MLDELQILSQHFLKLYQRSYERFFYTKIGDERTLKTYLQYLEDAGLIFTLTSDRGSLKGL